MIEKLRLFNTVSQAISAIPQLVATEAVNFSKARFVQQNWIDTNTEPWRKRRTSRSSKARNSGAILVDSGRLKRSIKKILVSSSIVVIGTDVPYAQANNDGYRGSVAVKAHKRKSMLGKTYDVKSHNKKVNIPKRRFVGQSAVLNNRIERVCTARIMQAIKSAL